jgi:iron complex outermembrane receptor protein
VVTRDVFNPNFSVQTGEVNVKGFEFEARTELTQQLSVIAAYIYLDGRITKSNIPGEAGNRPTFTPEHQASIWGQYTLGGHLEGLTLGGGIRYVGATSTFTPAATYAAPIGLVPAFVLTTPAYTLVDAMASYDLKHLSPSLQGATLRVNAINLFNTYYIAGCGTTINCSMGTARTVLATLSYRW